MARKFAKIRPNIWRTRLRELSPNAKLLGIYLMTNDRFQMVGIYHLPKVIMGLETSLEEDQLEFSMNELIEDGFCHYDEETMFVWITDMAFSQVADRPNEKQQKGILDELSRLYLEEECDFIQQFLAHYSPKFPFLPEHTEDLYW